VDRRGNDENISAWHNKRVEQDINMASQIQDEIFVAGAGGQGVLAFGRILAQAAIEEEKFVTYYPSYGAEIRGGTANCAVIISDKEIGSPVVSRYKTMIIMNAPSYAKFLSKLAPSGMLIVNSSLVENQAEQKNGAAQGKNTTVFGLPRMSFTFGQKNGAAQDKNKVISIPATGIAQKVGDLRCANVVMLGAYVRLKNIISQDSAVESMKKYFSKLSPAVLQANLEAFKEGIVAADAAGYSGGCQNAEKSEDFRCS